MHITLNEFFDDVLQSDQSHRFVKRIAVSWTVDSLNKRHVTLVSFLEILENDVERRVFKDEMTFSLIELAERFEGDGIFGIDQGQLFNEEETDNIVPRSIVDWHSRET